jgi:hypothetical protein
MIELFKKLFYILHTARPYRCATFNIFGTLQKALKGRTFTLDDDGQDSVVQYFTQQANSLQMGYADL